MRMSQKGKAEAEGEKGSEGEENASASLGGGPRPGSDRTEHVTGDSSPTPSRGQNHPDRTEETRIQPGRNRRMQAARAGKRKYFRAPLKKKFLEWFAATANAKWSAERIGIDYRTVWKHRMSDPVFAEAFDRALEQGTVRVRAKLIETKPKGPIDIDGDADAPELDEIDPQVALHLLREYERGRGGPAAGMGRKPGRRPRIATNAEVRAALVKRLHAFGIRHRARKGRG